MDNKLLLNSMDSISPLISIIVPVYKVENYLRRAVDSILRQTYTNIEVILVDDGSPDECPRICDEYAEKDCRVKVIHKPNGGLSDARNAALDIINGEYVTFVDSDDYISDEMISIFVHQLNRYKADIVTCGLNIIDQNENVYDHKVVVDDIIMSGVELTKLLLQDKPPYNFSCAKLFKALLFDDVRYPLNRYYEDTATTYRVTVKANVTVNLCSSLYYYELGREGNITSELNTKKAIKSYSDGITNCLEQIEFCKNDKRFLDIQETIIYTMFLWFLLGLQSATQLPKKEYVKFNIKCKELAKLYPYYGMKCQLKIAFFFPKLYYFLYPYWNMVSRMKLKFNC